MSKGKNKVARKFFHRLSLLQSVFSVNSHFEMDGLRADTGISPNQPYIPLFSININSSS